MMEPLPATLFDRLVARTLAPAPPSLAIGPTTWGPDAPIEAVDDGGAVVPEPALGRPTAWRRDDPPAVDAPRDRERPAPPPSVGLRGDAERAGHDARDPEPVVSPDWPRPREIAAPRPDAVPARPAVARRVDEVPRAVPAAEAAPNLRSPEPVRPLTVAPLVVRPDLPPRGMDRAVSRQPGMRQPDVDRQPASRTVAVLPAWAVVRPDLPAFVPEAPRAAAGTAAPPEPVVHVTIGRLEVRGPAEPRTRAGREPARSRQTLETFLSRRGGPA
jgi:hypothetical protein